MYRRFFKRFSDVVLSLIGIAVGLIPMILIALAVKIDSEGPVLYRQKRIGKDGKVFEILKFRSMCVGAERKGTGVYSEEGDVRVTKVGNILRKTSLDEIPQFFNILRGDMSFIGPRPPLTYHPWDYSEYTDEQRKMFNVRPGITGWAQVNGRKGVEWNRRIELNVWYVENVSFLLDLKILLTTVFKVLSNEDNINVGATVVAETAEVEAEETAVV